MTPPLPLPEPYKAAPPLGLSGETLCCRASSHLSILRSKNKAFLRFSTELGLCLLVQATLGRRTLIGARLKRVSNVSTPGEQTKGRRPQT